MLNQGLYLGAISILIAMPERRRIGRGPHSSVGSVL
jgi:hypothetical protein